MIYMNKYLIHPSPPFEKELTEIYNHIAFKLDSISSANKFYHKVKNAIYSLKYYPERYMKVYSLQHPQRNLRKLTIDNYIIIYEVNNNTRSSFYSTYIS